MGFITNRENNTVEILSGTKDRKENRHGIKADWNVNLSLFDREIFRKLYSIDYELQSMNYLIICRLETESKKK